MQSRERAITSVYCFRTYSPNCFSQNLRRNIQICSLLNIRTLSQTQRSQKAISKA